MILAQVDKILDRGDELPLGAVVDQKSPGQIGLTPYFFY